MKNPRQMRVANKVSYHRGEKSVDGCLTGVTTVAVETAVVMASAAMATMTAAVGAWSSPRRCHCRQRRTGAGGGRAFPLEFCVRQQYVSDGK